VQPKPPSIFLQLKMYFTAFSTLILSKRCNIDKQQIAIYENLRQPIQWILVKNTVGSYRLNNEKGT